MSCLSVCVECAILLLLEVVIVQSHRQTEIGGEISLHNSWYALEVCDVVLSYLNHDLLLYLIDIIFKYFIPYL